MNTKLSITLIAFLLFGGTFYFFAKSSSESPINKTVPQQDEGLSVEAFTKKVSTKEKIVLVYFHADWCVPCIKLKPIIDQIEKEQSKVVEILELDVDENPKIAIHFEINALPLFMIYKDGKKVWDHNAFLTKDELLGRINLYKVQ